MGCRGTGNAHSARTAAPLQESPGSIGPGRFYIKSPEKNQALGTDETGGGGPERIRPACTPQRSWLLVVGERDPFPEIQPQGHSPPCTSLEKESRVRGEAWTQARLDRPQIAGSQRTKYPTPSWSSRRLVDNWEEDEPQVHLCSHRHLHLADQLSLEPDETETEKAVLQFFVCFICLPPTRFSSSGCF